MLFLDDDIRWLNADKLNVASAGLKEYPVVGLQVSKHPDLSVIGHARRLDRMTLRSHSYQADHCSLTRSGSMASSRLSITKTGSAIIDHLRLGEVAVSGRSTQVVYNPFSNSERARFEEFGDILAFGLLWLIHVQKNTATTNSTLDAAQRAYWDEAIRLRFWREVLRQRAILLDELVMRLQLRSKQDISPLDSVQAAQQQWPACRQKNSFHLLKNGSKISPYGSIRLSCLPKADSVIKALAKLGLLHVVRMHEGNPGRVRAAWAFGANSARQMGVKVLGRRFSRSPGTSLMNQRPADSAARLRSFGAGSARTGASGS